MFEIRKLLQVGGERRVRVIDKYAEACDVFVVTIDMDDPKAWPKAWKKEAIEAVAKSEKWSEVVPGAVKVDDSRSRKEISAHALKLRDERWEIAKTFKGERRFYRHDQRNAAILETAQRFGRAASFIRDLLRAYYQGGMTVEAVAPNFHRCGRASNDGRTRGRKPSNASYEPFAWKGEQYALAVKFCRRVFLKDVTVTYKTVHKKLIAKYYVYLDKDGNPVPLGKGDRPSQGQIADLLRAHTTHQERVENRESEAEFSNNKSAKVGSALQDTLGPGDVFEIDASQIDNWAVAVENIRLVIGKATMYLIVDRASRLIVGFFFSLDNPSWACARMAILSLFRDKRELCEQYGVPYRESDWPAHGMMPERFFGDNAEMLALGSDSLPKLLNVGVTNARPLFCASKGSVECTFKLTHVHLKELSAGYEPARNSKKRRGKKYYETANMTFDALKRKMLEIIIRHNRSVQKNMTMDAEDIAAGKLPIPLEVFKRAIDKNVGLGSYFEEQEVRYCLLQQEQGTVTRYGIRLGWLVYVCEEAMEKEWFVEARTLGAFKVKLRFDTGLVNHIYVADRVNPEIYYRASLVYASQTFMNYSFAEVDVLMKKYKENVADALEVQFAQSIHDMHEDGLKGHFDHAVKPKRNAKKSPIARKKEMLASRPVGRELPDVTQVDGRTVVVNQSHVAAPSENEFPDEQCVVDALPAQAGSPRALPVAPKRTPGPPAATGMAASVVQRFFGDSDDDIE